MDTKQLHHVGQSDSKLKSPFIGVFPSDQLPFIETYPAALIANIDTHDQDGSHWVAIYLTKTKRGEFFDSFGRHPSMCSRHFKPFLETWSDAWTYNQRSMQSFWSAVCGQYCLYYLLRRVRGNSMASIVSTFNQSRVENDKKVHAFIQRHSPTNNTPIHDPTFILNQIATSFN